MRIQIRRLGVPLTITLLAAAIVVLAIVALSAGEAEAHHVGCGDTITTDTTLDGDLADCPNNGVVIGADDITLDLNGHTVDGDGELIDPCPKQAFCDTGILNDRHDGVTITGGTVTQFGTGAAALGVRDNQVRGLEASENTLNGLLIGESSRSRVIESSASANGLATDYPGIAVFGSNHIQITGTTSTGNGDLGLFVAGSDHNRFTRNTLSDNPEAGAIIEGDRNEVSRNRVARNGDGIVLSGSANTVARNRVLKSRGCRPGCGVGISLEDGRGNQIRGNEIRDALKTGIRLRSFVKRQELRDNVVRSNRVLDAGRNGLHVDSTGSHTLLARNYVSGAGHDGIQVKSRTATLTRNHASNNADLGIAAVAGVTDGGGNVASGNGDGRQCTHVACRPNQNNNRGRSG
jgi:parallel beta-helix repeat protein